MAVVLAGCGGPPALPPAENPVPETIHVAPQRPAASAPLPAGRSFAVRIYTPERGFYVFIDGEPVRDDRGELLQTPCEVWLPRGEYQVLVARDGFADTAQSITPDGDHELVLHPPRAEDDAAPDGILASAYFRAPRGEPIPLLSLNTLGREVDPYLSSDGQTIWFAAERAEGRGIFQAGRPSAFHFFERPILLEGTRGAELPAAPTTTADATLLVYVIPEKARIWGVARGSTGESFGPKSALYYAREGTPVWPAACISPDGLQLLWSESTPAGFTAWRSTRRSTRDEFRSREPAAVPDPRLCLSADGLRQYQFDGGILRRARRAAGQLPFGSWEVVAHLDLPNYRPSAQRRQFCVSADEQWLLYSDDPDGSGDLYMVRIFEGRGIGETPRGRPIPQREDLQMLAEQSTVSPQPAPPAQPAEPAARDIDPRTVPLPYASFREQLVRLLEAREYDAALSRVEEMLLEPDTADAAECLAWDRDDVHHILAFWDDVRTAATRLQPGDLLLLQGVRLEFTRFEADTIQGRINNREFAKPLSELEPLDLTALADRVLAKDDPAGQLRAGVFLHYARAVERSTAARLERAGEQGRTFRERLAGRTVMLAKQELERDNLAAALVLLAEVSRSYPQTRAAQAVQRLMQEAYLATKWERVGPRQWAAAEPGEYTAEAGRAAGSYLVSPRTYENFELQMEWRCTGVSGQGGVFFRYPGTGGPEESALKIQLANDAGVQPDQYSSGSLFKLQPPKVNAVLPEGEWNTLVLRVQGAHVRVWINGRAVLDTTAPESARPRAGYIALDGVVGGISYRKTLLMDLPAGFPE